MLFILPPRKFCLGSQMLLFTLDWQAVTDAKCNETCIEVFGLTDTGSKLKKSVRGFHFSFWVKLAKPSDTEELQGMLKSVKNTKVVYETTSLGSIEIAKFAGESQHFACVSSACSVCLRNAFKLVRQTKWSDLSSITTFEGSMSPVSRFLQKTRLSPHQWIAVPMTEKIHFTDIFDQHSKTLPTDFCVASFDIECLSHDCISFPDAKKELDTMEQIGIVLTYPFGTKKDEHMVLALQEINISDEYTFIKCESELHMFSAFCNIINGKVHFLASYNGFGFDFPYIIDRCDVPECKIFRKTFQTAAFGCQDYTMIEFPGVLQLDLLVHIRKEKKLESYKLDNVAKMFLNQQKHDVSPKQIFKHLRYGTIEERTTIAQYCIQDCDLVCKLMKKFAVVRSQFAMCDVTYCPYRKMSVSGQQARTLDLLARSLDEKHLLLPDKQQNANNSDESYEGATVLEAHAGLYNDPVAGLDFASLYPSIMIAQNLCVSTRHPGIPSDDSSYNFVNGVYFQKEPLGVIPTILNYLWKTRKATRTAMKQVTDQDILGNMQAQQLSYKLVMNSMYGFLGSSFTPIETKSIAKAVTFYGRHLLEQTQAIIMDTYGDKCKVVYGDSVTGDTLVCTEYGDIPIKELATEWFEYKHINELQESFGRKAKKQISYPLENCKCMTHAGLQDVQFIVRRKYQGLMYKIEFEDGTILKITPDHCIWDGTQYISAQDLKVGQEIPGVFDKSFSECGSEKDFDRTGNTLKFHPPATTIF